MKQLRFLLRYLLYRLRSRDAHGIHSPFVYDLYQNVIAVKAPFYVYDKIEYLRSQLLASGKVIEVTDLGAGRSGKRSIGAIAKRSAKPAKYGQLLFRLVNRFKPHAILELGTSLGLSSLYLCTPNNASKLLTIEGCPAIAQAAGENFKKFGAANIEQVTGDFDEVLPGALQRQQRLDFVFFDGNHRRDPTLRYFEQCLAYSNEQSVFVFDDIHWSAEMEEAWEAIKKHPSVTVTIDLFFVGLVFFRKQQAKEHFTLRF